MTGLKILTIGVALIAGAIQAAKFINMDYLANTGLNLKNVSINVRTLNALEQEQNQRAHTDDLQSQILSGIDPTDLLAATAAGSGAQPTKPEPTCMQGIIKSEGKALRFNGERYTLIKYQDVSYIQTSLGYYTQAEYQKVTMTKFTAQPNQIVEHRLKLANGDPSACWMKTLYLLNIN